MRIVVISDAHGRVAPVETAIERSRADIVAFLGDGLKQLEDVDLFYPDKKFYFVSGNCDFSSDEPTSRMFEVCGKKIFMTHGHEYQVKYTLENLKASARARCADVVLFGHTHEAYCKYEDGLYILNPGSVSQPRNGRPSYGIIDIESGGIMTYNCNL